MELKLITMRALLPKIEKCENPWSKNGGQRVAEIVEQDTQSVTEISVPIISFACRARTPLGVECNDRDASRHELDHR